MSLSFSILRTGTKAAQGAFPNGSALQEENAALCAGDCPIRFLQKEVLMLQATQAKALSKKVVVQKHQ